MVRDLYGTDRIGRIFGIESRIQGSRGIPDDWRGKKEHGGGMMLDWGVHMIDQALYMVKEKITDIYCRMSYILGEDCDDGFELNIGFESAIIQINGITRISSSALAATTHAPSSWRASGRKTSPS